MIDNQQLNDALAGGFMLVNVDLSSWTGRETDSTASRELTASKGATNDAAKVMKNLLAGADSELKRVGQAAAYMREFVKRRTVPFGMWRMIGATQAIQFIADLNAQKAVVYDPAVLALQTVWDQRVSEAQANLGTFEPGTYPSAAEIPTRFGLKVDLMPVPTISDFSRMNLPPELIDALGQRYAKQMAADVETAYTNMQERVLKQVRRIAHVLTKAGAGERTKIYDTLTTELTEAVSLLRTCNPAGKPEIEALAEKIETEILSVPVEVFRNSQTKAAEVAKVAHEVATEAALEDIWKL